MVQRAESEQSEEMKLDGQFMLLNSFIMYLTKYFNDLSSVCKDSKQSNFQLKLFVGQ